MHKNDNIIVSTIIIIDYSSCKYLLLLSFPIISYLAFLRLFHKHNIDFDGNIIVGFRVRVLF